MDEITLTLWKRAFLADQIIPSDRLTLWFSGFIETIWRRLE